MSKTKILAFSALWAMLFSCGSQDGGPPELKKQMLGTISPFDTLKVEFNSDIIDIDKLDSSNITANATLVSRNNSGRELRFVGKSTTTGGSLHFYDSASDSIIFQKLKNSDGYVKDRTVAYFSTHPILDSEPNDIERTANSITGDVKREIGYTFAGVIDKDIGTNTDGRRIFDLEDFYKLDLKLGDSITITASNSSTPFDVKFYGPCYPENTSTCNNKTITVTKTGILGDRIKSGHLEPGSGTDFEKPASFYIRVSDENITAGSNPYLITIKVQ